MAKIPARTFYTFAVTFEAHKGVSIKSARDGVRTAIEIAMLRDASEIKVHLLNKEVSYAKR